MCLNKIAFLESHHWSDECQVGFWESLLLIEVPLFSPLFVMSSSRSVKLRQSTSLSTRWQARNLRVLRVLVLERLLPDSILEDNDPCNLDFTLLKEYSWSSFLLYSQDVLLWKGTSFIHIAHPRHSNELDITLLTHWMLSLSLHISQVHYKSLGWHVRPSYMLPKLFWEVPVDRRSGVHSKILHSLLQQCAQQEKYETYLGPYW